MKALFWRISAVLLTIMAFPSCTTLQWRETDSEITERFQKKNIPSKVSYYAVDSLDLTIRIQEVSRPNNKINLVFFHGSPSSLSAWNAYLQDTTLLKKANMIAIDRPGYGYSNFGDEMPDITLQADIMSALFKAYELENVIAIGSSYGGPLAARVAVLNSNVKGVVMISPAIDPEQEKHIKGVLWTQFWLTRWMVPTGYRVAGDEKMVHAKELARLEKDWKELGVPVIHIHGDKDDIVPYGNVNYTKETFPTIEIITTPNTGHEIAWGRPELIKPHVDKLIEKIVQD
ncbi:MAG: alpha/beta hydrolase [Bacteroidetes bacterium]|nr:alpha/beta hydrolase [Bacteroidota bacterium]